MYPPSHRAGFLRALVFAAACACLNGQQPAAVFNDFSPTVKGVTHGTSQCIMWQLAPPSPWKIEVACYTAGVLKQVQAATADDTPVGSFPLLDGSGTIGWIVLPNGEASMAFAGTCGSNCTLPNSASFAWTFPAP